MGRILKTIAIILLLGVFLFSGWKLLGILREYQAGQACYEEMEQFISVPATVPTAPAETTPIEETPEESLPPQREEPAWPQVDFIALRRINPDVVGWIYVPGTRISYPVVQGSDNDQYLYRLFTGEHNGAGSIFLHAGLSKDFSARNNPIYGHNMKNGTMFADLAGYKSQSFFEEHPTAMLLTQDTNYLVHIFSGYVTNTWGDAWELNFMDEDAYGKWQQSLVEDSYFQSDVIPTTEDSILTFSTCSYETSNGRFVVHGVLEAFPKQ